jgi:hypothetical protein
MNKQLSRYDKARNALAEARSVDEVKDVLNTAAALKEYARRARDEQLMADAAAIQQQATRRLGEVMAEDLEAGRSQRIEGGDPQRASRSNFAGA